MKCPVQSEEDSELLLDYCAKTLDPDRTAILEEHMVACAECRAFRDAQSALWTAMERWKPLPISPDFNRRLYARIEQEESHSWRRRLFPEIPPLLCQRFAPMAAASLVIMAAFLYQLGLYRPTASFSLTTPPSVTEPSHEAVDAGELEKTLEDMEMLRALPML